MPLCSFCAGHRAYPSEWFDSTMRLHWNEMKWKNSFSSGYQLELLSGLETNVHVLLQLWYPICCTSGPVMVLILFLNAFQRDFRTGIWSHLGLSIARSLTLGTLVLGLCIGYHLLQEASQRVVEKGTDLWVLGHFYRDWEFFLGPPAKKKMTHRFLINYENLADIFSSFLTSTYNLH